MTRDELLAARTPRELFGDALDDPKQLKRAYARLVRDFGPETDPSAFEHLRALYERAQEPESPAEVPTEPVVRSLKEAFAQGRPHDALATLQAHDLTLRVEQPGVWYGAVTTLVDALTFDLPVDVLHSWLEASEHVPDGLPPPVGERIETLALAGLAFQQARVDPQLPPELLTLLRSWGRPVEETARAFVALGEAVPDPEALWKVFAHVGRHHPGLVQPLTLMADAVTLEHEAWVALKEGPWLPATAAKAPILAGPPWLPRLVHVLAALPPCAALLMWTPLPEPLPSACRAAVLPLLGLWGLAWAARHLLGSPSYPRVRARLVAFAQHEVLFPHEVVALCVGSAPQGPLLAFQKDVGVLCHLLTEAHVVRIAARRPSSG